MSETRQMVSRELLEKADRVIGCYDDLDEPSMALVTGSVARGLSDDASDLDVYLYREQVDRGAIEATPRVEQLGARRIIGVERPAGYFEKYWLDGRFVDVESVSTVMLEVTSEAMAAGEVTDAALSLACSLRDAVARRGADELARWHAQLVYSDELARSQVRSRGGRLLAPSALFELSYRRGDTLTYAGAGVGRPPRRARSAWRRESRLSAPGRTEMAALAPRPPRVDAAGPGRPPRCRAHPARSHHGARPRSTDRRGAGLGRPARARRADCARPIRVGPGPDPSAALNRSGPCIRL